MTIDHRQSARAGEALRSFLATPLDRLLDRDDGKQDPAAGALALFREVAASVPAYRAFLAEQGVDVGRVRGVPDFAALPMVTKQNYLTRHPLAQLCRGGRLESCDFVAVSSGSTGEPTFWPRFVTRRAADRRALRAGVRTTASAADQRRTLAVVCFALGSWVGGMYTSRLLPHLAAKGYPITVVTPGNQREEIWRVVRALAPQFEQTVLLGYPPFLKDVVDGGIAAAGIDWRRSK